MTVVADSKQRVRLHFANPGDRFDVQSGGDGKFILTRLEPVEKSIRAKVRIVKRGKYSVGILTSPINPRALKEALAEVP